MTISVVKKANASSTGDNRACSDGRSRKDKCGDSERFRAGNGGFSEKGPLYYGGGQRKELLCMWGFQAYGLPL